MLDISSRFHTLILISLGILLVIPIVTAADVPDFQDVIKKAQIEEGSDRRPDLRRCIRQWDIFNGKRAVLYGKIDEHATDVSRKQQVILEMGNSGFPKYEYIHVYDDHLSSSFGDDVDLSKFALYELLVQAYSDGKLPLLSRAYDHTEDEDCYFLTVFTDGGKASVAIYGQLRPTFTGLFISYLIDVAKYGRHK